MKGIDIEPTHLCTLCGEQDADVERFRDGNNSIWYYHRACAAMWSDGGVYPPHGKLIEHTRKRIADVAKLTEGE